MKKWRQRVSRAMKAVPGVMQLESKGSAGTPSPFSLALAICELHKGGKAVGEGEGAHDTRKQSG